jgi:hypothetical protein
LRFVADAIAQLGPASEAKALVAATVTGRVNAADAARLLLRFTFGRRSFAILRLESPIRRPLRRAGLARQLLQLR